MAEVAAMQSPAHDPVRSPPSSSLRLSHRETRLARFASKRARLDSNLSIPLTSTSEQRLTAAAADVASTPDAVPTSCCQHYLARKQRYCDRLPLPAQRYCSHHSEVGRTRCEACGTLVRADELAKHRRLCPAASRAEVAQSWPFRVLDINTTPPRHLTHLVAPGLAPTSPPPPPRDAATESSVLRVDLLVERIRQSLRAHAPIQRLARSAHSYLLPVNYHPPDDLSSHCVTPSTVAASADSTQTPCSPTAPPEASPRLRKFSKQRHQRQCAALVHAMVSEQLLQSPHCTVVEMGAGKAGLSHCLLNSEAKELANVEAVVLVDSDTFKSKWDAKMRSAGQVERRVERYQLDIKDLHIASLPSLSPASASSSPAHALLIGKHLCGAALDWCINAVLHSSRPSPSASAPLPPLVSGLCIASCCHHRCTFDSYCNPRWLHAHGVDRQQFALLARLSSWACNDDGRGTTHGWRASGYEVQEETVEGGARVEYGSLIGSGVGERITIGRAIKQWLDTGRVQLLRAVGYSAHLTLFASSHITRENVALVAKFEPVKANAERVGQSVSIDEQC